MTTATWLRISEENRDCPNWSGEGYQFRGHAYYYSDFFKKIVQGRHKRFFAGKHEALAHILPILHWSGAESGQFVILRSACIPTHGIDECTSKKECIMQKRILVAVDASMHARNALLYAAGLSTGDVDLHYTLLNIQPIISEYFLEEARTDSKINQALDRVFTENSANSFEILKKSKEVLVRAGAKEGSIETVSQIRVLGLTRDIIEYAHKHQFDAIVAGRRGLSRIQKLFMGSTSAKLLEHSGKLPVWIVDGQVRPRRILAAVDLQEMSSIMVEYLGRMCGGMQSLHLTFFHVLEYGMASNNAPFTPELADVEEKVRQSEVAALEQFWVAARTRLLEAGFKEDQLEIKSVRRTAKTGKMIIDEVEVNDYDTVVMGRTGGGKAFYFGSVSRYVSERLTDHALWLIG